MKKHLLRVLSILVILALSTGLLAACQSQAQPPASTPDGSGQSQPEAQTPQPPETGGQGAPSGDPIKIGLLVVMAGIDAYIGQSAYQAGLDYIEEINANGGLLGRPLELIAYDISLDTSESVSATNRLIGQDGVVAIVGPDGSDYAMPLAPIAEAAQVPIVATTATNALVTVNADGSVKPYMFRVCFPDDYQGKALAQYAYNEMGLRKVATIACVTSTYSNGLGKIFNEEFKRLGGEITFEEGYQANDTEFRSQLAKMHDSGAEAVFSPAGEYRIMALMAKQSSDLGYKDMIFLGADGWYAQELLENAGAELEGSVFTNGIIEDDPRFLEYSEQFYEKHGMYANIYAFYVLDALQAIEAAIIMGNSAEGKDIRDNLEKLVDVPVFSGTLTIEPDTHNPYNKDIYILQITGGEFKVLDVYKPE